MNNTNIKFGPRPPVAEATFRSPFPFTVYISADDIGYNARNPEFIDYETNLPGHDVHLYSKFSNSQPFQTIRNRWSVLVPQWHFEDISGNKIDTIKTIDTALYDLSSNFIGVSGYAEFYYVDDMPTDMDGYLLLIATLETSGFELSADNTKQYEPSYANSRAVAVLNYNVNGQVPGKLQITRNALSGEDGYIQSPQWQNQHIHHVITVNGDLYDDDVCDDGYRTNMAPIVFSYPETNEIGLKYPIQRKLFPFDTSFDTTTQYWSPCEIFFIASSANVETRGYVFSDLVALTSFDVIPLIQAVSSISPNITSDQAKYMDYISGPWDLTLHLSANQMGVTLSAWNWQIDDTYYIQSSGSEFLTYTYSDFLTASTLSNISVTGYLSAGYSYNTVVSTFDITLYPDITSYGAKIIAGVSAEYQSVFRDTPFIWISNPENKVLNRIFYPPYGNIEYTLQGLGTINIAASSEVIVYPVPGIGDQTDLTNNNWKSYYTDNYDLSGFGGIYGMAVDKCYNLWTVDPEQDILRKFNAMGELLFETRISPNGCSPVGISLDEDTNAWISLYGAVSCIKLDHEGNFTGVVAIPNGYDATTETTDDIIYRPVGIETDVESNVWVAYENYKASALIKYDSTGVQLVSCALPLSAQPQDIVVDPIRNYCWVTNSYEMLSSAEAWDAWENGQVYPGSVQLWSTTGVLISSFQGFDHPEYITIDRHLGVWFTFGYHSVGHITSGGDVNTFIVSAGDFISYPNGDFPYDWNNFSHEYNETLQGIACDARERIWILNSLENRVYVVSAHQTSFNQPDFISFKIRPDSGIGWYNITGTQETFYDEWNRSAQCFGDWTGYRWLQKYYPYLENNWVITYITGESNYFLLKKFQDNYDIRKMNDSWSPSDAVQKFTMPQHFRDNPNLFNLYLKNMLGTSEFETETDPLLRESYEKIANFVNNNVNVDNCGINQLYALAKETDVPIDDYNFSFPPEIKKCMDLFSIKKDLLFGGRCSCNLNINPNMKTGCPYCNHNHTNVGDYLTENLVGGDKYIIHPKGTDIYTLTSISSGLTFNDIITDDCLYFEYLPQICDIQTEGVIDWNSEYTTISENASSVNQWFGQDGTVEEIFNFILRNNIFGRVT